MYDAIGLVITLMAVVGGVLNVLEQMEIAGSAYRLLGAPDHLSQDIFEGEHRWNGIQAYPWLDRWLKSVRAFGNP